MRKLFTLAILNLLLLWSPQGNAQPLLLQEHAPASSWSVFSQAGLDQSLLTLGVGAAWRPQGGRLTQLSFGLDSPLFSPDLDDAKLTLSSQWELWRFRGLHIPLSVGMDSVSTSNDVFTGRSFANTLALLPHWQGQGWLIGAELSWRQSWLTHITHTELYKKKTYAQAQDGWYSTSASTLRYGLRGAWKMGSALEGYAQVGLQRDGVFNVLIPPYYANVGVSLRF